MAEPREIADRVGQRTLTGKTRIAELRPSLVGSKVKPEQLGWKWGKARGVGVWTSVRDAVVLLGPSGAGKGVYVVIPRVLDAPGPVVVTSTRPDVLTATLTARAKLGPVGVISADGSVGELAETVKWSPIRGCTDGRIATARAQVLAAGSSAGVEDANFWQGWTEKVIKALLHAAALGDKGIDDLWRWSQSAPRRKAAVTILDVAEQNPKLRGTVEAGWSATLAEVVDGDEKFRGNVWAGVGRALAGLDLAAVRRRFDPAPGKGFDPQHFLAANGTLYLLAEEDDPASRLLQCLVDDITRVAKQHADRSPRGRLDPPLTLMLDEIANFAPLPKLPVFVSAYGGAGIVTFVVIQSRQQMNRTWGTAAAEAIWDAATIKGILGGITSADDLRDFSAITGERDETTWSTSTGHSSGSGLLGALGSSDSYSEQLRTHPVLKPGEIRGLPEGTALMFYKGLDPMLVEMTAYYQRRDARLVERHRNEVEQRISTGIAHLPTGS